jgi:hypothetical protein
MKQIAKDGEQPGIQVRPPFEPMQIGERSQDGVLNKIVGPVDLTRQRNGKSAKAGNRSKQSLS